MMKWSSFISRQIKPRNIGVLPMCKGDGVMDIHLCTNSGHFKAWEHSWVFYDQFTTRFAHIGVFATPSEVMCLRRLQISLNPEVCVLPVSRLTSPTILKWARIWKSSSVSPAIGKIDNPQVRRVTHCSLFINHDPNSHIDPVEKIRVAPSIFQPPKRRD